MNFNDYDLSNELRAKLTTDYDANVSDLKAKNTELIEREKLQKEANESLKLSHATDAEKAKLDIAEASGNVKTYKKQLAESKETLNSVKHEFSQEKDERIKLDALNVFSANLVSGSDMGRKGMIDTFKENTKVVDGVLVTNDPSMTVESLTSSLITDKANAGYVVVKVGSGAGSTGSNGGFSSVKSLKDMTATEEAILANEDPALYQLLLTK